MTTTDVTRQLFERYRDMLPEIHQAHQLSVEALEHVEEWPIDKSSRWLGFVQALVITGNFTTVRDERDFSRPLFHQAYRDMGIAIPPSIEL